MRKSQDKSLIIGLLLAFFLWYLVFLSDILYSFWYRVTLASIILAAYAYRSDKHGALRYPTLREITFGIGSGLLLYALFYVGFNLFKPFVAGGASNVYLFRTELPLIIPAGLLLATSFCEEYFWRMYSQRSFINRYNATGVLINSLIYAAIHITTMNIPLVFAALIAGLFWGILYEQYDSFWVIVFSHITWTELIFVISPLL